MGSPNTFAFGGPFFFSSFLYSSRTTFYTSISFFTFNIDIISQSMSFTLFLYIFFFHNFCGSAWIRTKGPQKVDSLAESWFKPLTHTSIFFTTPAHEEHSRIFTEPLNTKQYAHSGRSGTRTHKPISRPSVFKTDRLPIITSFQ